MSEQEVQAQMNVLTQYVRRVVFENTAAAEGRNPGEKPTINVQVNVQTNTVSDHRYVVALLLTIETMSGEDEVFAVELDYIGVFQLSGVPDEAIEAVLSIECPRMLFPFARRIIAEVTRDGGYPPLMLDPIDFAALYRRQLQQAQSGAQEEETAANGVDVDT